MSENIFEIVASRLFADPMDEMVNTCIYPVYNDSYHLTKQLIERKNLLTGTQKQQDCGVYLFGEAVKLGKSNALRAFLDAGLLRIKKDVAQEGLLLIMEQGDKDSARLLRDEMVTQTNASFVACQGVVFPKNGGHVNG